MMARPFDATVIDIWPSAAVNDPPTRGIPVPDTRHDETSGAGPVYLATTTGVWHVGNGVPVECPQSTTTLPANEHPSKSGVAPTVHPSPISGAIVRPRENVAPLNVPDPLAVKFETDPTDEKSTTVPDAACTLQT